MYLSHVITFITVSILDIFVCVMQYWNRLSSLQRSIICMMVIFGTLSGVYIIPTIYEDYASLEHAARNRNEASFHDSGVLPTNIDDIVKNSINYVYNKAKQLKANSSVVSFVVFFFQFLQMMRLFKKKYCILCDIFMLSIKNKKYNDITSVCKVIYIFICLTMICKLSLF